jgi:hypothetical protein
MGRKHGALSALALGAMVASCSEPADPRRDAGARDGGAGADAGELERDGGPRDAAGFDAGARDGGSDAGRRDAGPPGECWVVPQSGCPEGHACREAPGDDVTRCYPPPFCTRCQPDTGWFHIDCTESTCGECRPAGAESDRCPPGYICLTLSNQCIQQCARDEDCLPRGGDRLFCRGITPIAGSDHRIGECQL